MGNRWYNRKLRIGDYLDYGVEFFRCNGKRLLALMTVFHVPLSIVIDYLLNPGDLLQTLGDALLDTLPLGTMLGLMGGMALQNLYSITLYFALQIAVIYFTYRKLAFQETHTVRASLRRGFRGMGWMILYEVLLSAALSVVCIPIYFAILFGAVYVGALLPSPVLPILLLVGILALLVAAIFFAVRLAFVPHAIAARGCNSLTAIRLSWQYTRKHFWCTFGTMVWVFGIVNGISIVVNTASALLSVTGSLTLRLLHAFLQGVVAFLQPVGFVITTILFFRLEADCADASYEKELHQYLRERGV